MAAVTAQAAGQDVSYKDFDVGATGIETQEEDSVEDIVSEVVTQNSEISTGKKFTLGAEDGSELFDEFAFSLQHSAALPSNLQADIHSEMARLQEEEIGGFMLGHIEGQPPPGHWVGQPSGEASGL